MKKLYLYPHRWEHSHDGVAEYVDTTPLSRDGIKRHFQVVTNPKDCDFFYMGQLSDGNMNIPDHPVPENSFTYLPEFPERHMLDLEGDWINHSAPAWTTTKTIKSGNATKKENFVQPFCVRPCLSYLLMFLAKDTPEYDLEFPDSVSVGFRGFPDPHGVRLKMQRCMANVATPSEVIMNNTWCARQPLESGIVSEYISLLHRHILSLCPRGAGTDSIRFYESCFFGRVPVIISDMAIMGADFYDVSFVFRISPDLSDAEMTKELEKVCNTPHAELVEKGKAARQYFMDVIVKYFQDPTKYFIDWMKRQNLYVE